MGGNYPESLKGRRLWHRGKKDGGTIIIIIIIENAARSIVGQILGLLIIGLEIERLVGSLKFLRISDQQLGAHQIDYHSARKLKIFIPI